MPASNGNRWWLVWISNAYGLLAKRRLDAPLTNWTVLPAWNTSRAIAAASGAVNRLARTAPAANPTAVSAATALTPTTTGHNGGPPQVAWVAATP